MDDLDLNQSGGLDNAQKVAALLLSLLPVDRQAVVRLLARFDPDELSSVTQAASAIGTVAPALVADQIEEFLHRLEDGPGVLGGARHGRVLLEAARENGGTAAIQAAPSETAEKTIWDKCEAVPLPQIANWIEREKSHIAAFWLSKLSPELSSNVLSAMPPARAAAIVERLARMKRPSPQATIFMEGYLERKLDGANTSRAASGEAALEIVARMDAEVLGGVMEQLSEHAPAVASRLKEGLFNFADIVSLSGEDRVAIFEKVSQQHVIASLQGAGADLIEAVVSSLGARSRRMVEQELERKGGISRKDIAAARQAVTSVVLQLSKDGLIRRQAASDSL